MNRLLPLLLLCIAGIGMTVVNQRVVQSPRDASVNPLLSIMPVDTSEAVVETNANPPEATSGIVTWYPSGIPYPVPTAFIIQRSTMLPAVWQSIATQICTVWPPKNYYSYTDSITDGSAFYRIAALN